MDYETLVSIFWTQSERLADKPALRVKQAGSYGDISWPQLSNSVLNAGAGLLAAGMEGGDRVGILSENRLECIEADFAILPAGGDTDARFAPLTGAEVREQ